MGYTGGRLVACVAVGLELEVGEAEGGVGETVAESGRLLAREGTIGNTSSYS